MKNRTIKSFINKLLDIETTLEPKEGKSSAKFRAKILFGEPDFSVSNGSIRLGLKRGVLTLVPHGCTIPIHPDDPYLHSINGQISTIIKETSKNTNTATKNDSIGVQLTASTAGPKLSVGTGHKSTDENKRETTVEKLYCDSSIQIWRQGKTPETEWVFHPKGTSATLKGFVHNKFATVESHDRSGFLDVTFTARRKDIEIIDTEGFLLSIVRSLNKRTAFRIFAAKLFPTKNNRLLLSQGSLQFLSSEYERQATHVPPLPQLPTVNEIEFVSALEVTGKALVATQSDDFSKLLTAARLNPKTDLAGADLNHVDMRGIDLSGADLSDTDFTGAKLTNANLSGCDLRFADFSKSHIDRIKIDNAVVNGANLSSAIGLADSTRTFLLVGGARLTDLQPIIGQALNIDFNHKPELTFNPEDKNF